MAVFDVAVNNTDRKAGHLLPVPGGRIYGVDHGVCFSAVPKLRTVLWAWRGTLWDSSATCSATCEPGSKVSSASAPLAPRAPRGRGHGAPHRPPAAAGVFPYPDPRRPALPWPPV